MAQQGVILVTGATGNVGRQVVHQLVDEGHAVRAFVRDPGTARLPDSVEVCQGDFTDPDTLEPALAGVDAAFLVWPSLPLEDAPAVVGRLAAHAGKIVYLSSASVDDDKEDQGDPINTFHAGVERLIAKSGASWTFLRCTSFAASLLEWADQVREGVVREAFGESTRTLIHERDIAAVGVREVSRFGTPTLVTRVTNDVQQVQQVLMTT